MFRDVIDYHIRYYDAFEVYPVIMNLDLWNSLTPSDQELVAAVMEEQIAYFWDRYEADEKNLLKEAEDAGIEIIYLTDAELRANAEAAREGAWPVIREIIGDSVYNEVVELAEELP